MLAFPLGASNPPEADVPRVASDAVEPLEPYPAPDEDLFYGSPVRNEPLAERAENIEVVTMMKLREDSSPLAHHLVQYLKAGLPLILRIFGVEHTHIEYAERAAQERVNGITDLDHEELPGAGTRRIRRRGQAYPVIARGQLHVG